jgi:hypothetical protein
MTTDSKASDVEAREREAFEAAHKAEWPWRLGAFYQFSANGGTYIDQRCEHDWQVWKLARASQQPSAQELDDGAHMRICALEAQLRSAAGVLRSVAECRSDFMPRVVRGEIDDIAKLLPQSPDTERKEG